MSRTLGGLGVSPKKVERGLSFQKLYKILTLSNQNLGFHTNMCK